MWQADMKYFNPLSYNVFFNDQVKNEAEQQVGRIAFLRSSFVAV